MSKLEFCLVNLESFSRSYHMSRLLRDIYPTLDKCAPEYGTFQHLHNTLLCDSSVSWCRTFGSDKEELHWKKISPNESRFREDLLNEAGLTLEEFATYRQSLITFRNKVASHFDPQYFTEGSTPHFELANKLANKAYSLFCEMDDRYVNRIAIYGSLEEHGTGSAKHLIDRL